MKVTIESFKNLKHVEFETPCSIYGKNGKGKSNSLNAILWVLSEKNTESEKVIPFGEESATVSVKIRSTDFKRSICWKMVRKTGEMEAKKTGTVSSYFINDENVNKSTFFEKVREEVGQVQYSDPLFFFSKKNDEKLQIINKIVALPKPTDNIAELARAVKTAKKDVDASKSIIKDIENKIIDISDIEAKSLSKSAEIETLNLQIISKNPEVEQHNANILAQIQEENAKQFKPKAFEKLIDIEPIQKQLNELTPLEVVAPELRIPKRPLVEQLPREPIMPLPFEIDGNCEHCGSELYKSPNAKKLGEEEDESRMAEYEKKMDAWVAECKSIEDLNKQNQQAWVDAKEKEKERYELAADKYEADMLYNSKISARKKELENQLSEADKTNEDLRIKNSEIEKTNIADEKEFQALKEKNIQSLKSQLKSQDYTTANEAILAKIKTVEAEKKVFDDAITINENYKNDLQGEKIKLTEFQQRLISAERKHIEAKEILNAWKNNFDSKCLALFNGKVKIATTRETYSDTTEDCFEVYFNRDGEFTEFSNLNHSDQILCGVEISKVLCQHFGVKIPLLIDNAEAINEARRPEGAVLAIVDENIDYLIKN